MGRVEVDAPHQRHAEAVARGRYELAELVRRAISQLPSNLRLTTLLRYVDDLSYEEIAAALHCSCGTVASRLNRSHRLLAATLAPLRGTEVPDK